MVHEAIVSVLKASLSIRMLGVNEQLDFRPDVLRLEYSKTMCFVDKDAQYNADVHDSRNLNAL